MAQGTEQSETTIITETSTDHSGTQVVEVVTVHTETTHDAHLTAPDTGEESAVAEIFDAILDPLPATEDEGHTVEVQEFIIVESGHDESHSVEADAHLAPAEEMAHAAEPQAESHADAQADAHADAQAGAHADAATEAQHQADEHVAAGDYEAAAHAREEAESHAWEAGHGDMLHGSTSAELSHAADEQQQAEWYEHQESQYAAEGNYQAAQDAAGHAAEATGWADYHAGGEDHTGQARLEEWHEGWAVHEQQNAEGEIHTAEYYAESGNAEQAQTHAELAGEHLAEADHQGDMGQHDGPASDHDYSSDVAHDASHDVHDAGYDASHDASSYDAHSYDAHSYDAHETDV